MLWAIEPRDRSGRVHDEGALDSGQFHDNSLGKV